MRTILKVLLYALVVVGSLAAAAVGFVAVRSASLLTRLHPVSVEAPSVPSDADSIARGRHIAATRGCADCHGKDLGGALVYDTPPMGTVYAPNLTRGEGGLARSHTDSDLVLAIRHGVAPSGRALFLMPSADYSHFSEEDVSDLIAYLHSLPPVDRRTPPIKLGPVSRALLAFGEMKLSADEIDHSAVRPETVARGETAAYGRYLSVMCTGCHGANFSGGRIASGPPDWPPAANLTPDPSGHLGQWTEGDFIRTLRTARRPDGSSLNPVMPRSFAGMDDTELKAIWAYLRTLPAAPTGSR